MKTNVSLELIKGRCIPENEYVYATLFDTIDMPIVRWYYGKNYAHTEDEILEFSDMYPDDIVVITFEIKGLDHNLLSGIELMKFNNIQKIKAHVGVIEISAQLNSNATILIGLRNNEADDIFNCAFHYLQDYLNNFI